MNSNSLINPSASRPKTIYSQGRFPLCIVILLSNSFWKTTLPIATLNACPSDLMNVNITAAIPTLFWDCGA